MSDRDLFVPDEAVLAQRSAFQLHETREEAETAVREIARPVVAAELRAWSEAAITPLTNTGQNDYERGVQAGVRIAADRLRRRADELDRQRITEETL